MERFNIYGEPSIRTVLSSIFWDKRDGIGPQQSASSVICCVVRTRFRTPWSRTGFAATPLHSRVCCPKSNERGHWLNNRAENSHQPTRERERRMRRFKSPEQAQQFLSTHSIVRSHFRPRRHRLTAHRYRAVRRQRFQQWNTVVQAGPLAIPFGFVGAGNNLLLLQPRYQVARRQTSAGCGAGSQPAQEANPDSGEAKLNCKSQAVRPATLLLDPTPVFLRQQPVPNHLPSAKKMVGRL